MNSWHKNPILIMTIAACITGFLLMMSIRSYSPLFSKTDNSQQQSVITYINQLEEDINALETNISTARTQMDKLRQQQSQETDTAGELQQTIDWLSRTAGYSAQTGAGVILTLEDNDKGAALAQKNSATYNAEEYIIHDKNLLYIVRGLSQVASAIAINEQRIVDTSNIRCVGTVIMVNSSRLAPPYEIKILGNPELIEATLTELDEYENLEAKDMPMKLTAEEQLTVPAYNGSNTTTYAELAQ